MILESMHLNESNFLNRSILCFFFSRPRKLGPESSALASCLSSVMVARACSLSFSAFQNNLFGTSQVLRQVNSTYQQLNYGSDGRVFLSRAGCACEDVVLDHGAGSSAGRDGAGLPAGSSADSSWCFEIRAPPLGVTSSLKPRSFEIGYRSIATASPLAEAGAAAAKEGHEDGDDSSQKLGN